MNPKKQKVKQRRRARKLADEAWQAVEADNLDLALKIIRRAVEAQLDNPVLWHDQGVILALRQQDREAEESFRAALRLAPTFADAYAQLASLQSRHGFLDEAVALQVQAVKFAPQAAGHAERLEAYRTLAASRRAPASSRALPAGQDDALPEGHLSDAGTEDSCFDGLRRLAALDWEPQADRLTCEGCVLLPQLLDPDTCAQLRNLFDQDAWFAKTVVMDRPEFGRGAYRYFREPLPAVVVDLRRAAYPHVARVANRWQALLKEPERYPEEWDTFREKCRRAGQTVPTPILLRYGPGGFNALHRDLRGPLFFPVQMAVVLSPRVDETGAASQGFQGGEFLFCDVPEGRKSRRKEVAAGLGDAVLFCTRDRLVCIGGAYGLQPVKHGAAEVIAGTRVVLGLPFHDYR